MSKNTVLSNFYVDTRRINFNKTPPTMKSRTLGALGVKSMRFGNPPKVEEGYRRLGWYIRCEKCSGSGLWNHERAIADRFYEGEDRETCFACGLLNNGWFRAPDCEFYQQSCVLWVLDCLDNEDTASIARMAKSQVAKAMQLVPDYDRNHWICQVGDFWMRIQDSLARHNEGGLFFTEEEIDSSVVLKRAMRAREAAETEARLMAAAEELDPVTKLPAALISVLREAWDKVTDEG